jgi:hypothetical protein
MRPVAWLSNSCGFERSQLANYIKYLLGVRRHATCTRNRPHKPLVFGCCGLGANREHRRPLITLDSSYYFVESSVGMRPDARSSLPGDEWETRQRVQILAALADVMQLSELRGASFKRSPI